MMVVADRAVDCTGGALHVCAWASTLQSIDAMAYVATSRYPEDVLVGGHASVFGSFFCTTSRRWGFVCCRVLDRGAPCPLNSQADVTTSVYEGGECDAAAEQSTRQCDPVRGASRYQRDHSRFVPRSECSSPEEFSVLAVRHLLLKWREQEAACLADQLEGVGRAGLRAQTEIDIGALLVALGKGSLDKDDMGKLEQVLEGCLNRDYTAAEQAYMHLVQGNAKWQLGGVAMYNQRKMRVVKHNEDHLLAQQGMQRAMNALKRLISFARAKLPQPDASQTMSAVIKIVASHACTP